MVSFTCILHRDSHSWHRNKMKLTQHDTIVPCSYHEFKGNISKTIVLIYFLYSNIIECSLNELLFTYTHHKMFRQWYLKQVCSSQYVSEAGKMFWKKRWQRKGPKFCRVRFQNSYLQQEQIPISSLTFFYQLLKKDKKPCKITQRICHDCLCQNNFTFIVSSKLFPLRLRRQKLWTVQKRKKKDFIVQMIFFFTSNQWAINKKSIGWSSLKAKSSRHF